MIIIISVIETPIVINPFRLEERLSEMFIGNWVFIIRKNMKFLTINNILWNIFLTAYLY